MRNSPIFKGIGIGIVAGMRTFSAPAITSRYLVRQNRHASQSSASNPMASSWLGGILTLAAAGELVADKLPSIPSRISPPLLTGRFISGAICGASIYHAEGKPADVGAVIGGLSAIASAYITY